MFSRFFINRPIFASVLSIVIVLGGSIALFTLPVAQYPDIAPPTVEVSASYPGANAQVVADTVAAPIEQQVNGVEGMMYMSSQCTNDGNYTLTVTFKPGSDLNISQVLVQNRESLAEPILPDLVKRRGISVKKKSPNVLLIVNLVSQDESRTSLELSNYATIQIRDELSRLPGVGDITYLGQRDYSMRLWLDPQKLSAYNLNAQDVINAVQAQNVQVAAGRIGQPPTSDNQVFQYIITTLGRLESTDQFGKIILKSVNGSLVFLQDVASIELGAQSYDQTCTLDGKPSVALSVYQLPGSNALQVADRVKQRMKQLRQQFPPGIQYSIVYDTTPFINESIKDVFETLFDAIVLVAVVVLVFLRIGPDVDSAHRRPSPLERLRHGGHGLQPEQLDAVDCSGDRHRRRRRPVVERSSTTSHEACSRAASFSRHGAGFRSRHRHRPGSVRRSLSPARSVNRRPSFPALSDDCRVDGYFRIHP